MQRVWTQDIAAHIDQPVRLAGWLQHARHLRRVSFLLLRDATGIAQVVVEEPGQIEGLQMLLHESVLEVTGVVRRNPAAPGGLELHDPRITVAEPAVEPPPFDLFRPVLNAQLPTILDHAALSLRHPQRRALWQLAAASLHGFRQSLQARHFTEVKTPKIVATATESGANVFQLDYFGQPAYLAQSPQLYKQILVGVFERVFEVGSVFRAEPHDTPRHLNEYTSLDAELGFIDDHQTVMQIVTDVVRGMLAAIQDEAADALAVLGIALPYVPDPIPSLHFTEALALIAAETGEKVDGVDDLAPAHERLLGEWARRVHASDLLFVTGYPMTKRPFYTHPDPARPGSSNSFDLLFRGLEIVTGGQRLHRLEDYLQALRDRDLPAEPFAGYLAAFRHGMPPHGGFAIGLERWVAQLAGVPNIRFVALFPRDLHRLTP